MSTSFLQNVELTKDIFDKNALLVVHQEGQVDGSFLLHFLTSEFSRIPVLGDIESKMLLILNHQSTCHWSSIATKLGWNIESLKDRGQLAVVDTLKTTYELLIGLRNNDSPSPDTTAVLSSSDTNTSIGNLSLDLLLDKCVNKVNELFGTENTSVTDSHDSTTKLNKKLFILLEDFSYLVQCAEDSEKHGLEFLRRLRFLRADLDICLVTLVYSTEEDFAGKYFSNLISQVFATTTFHVTQLRTGFSSEIHGVLTIHQQDKVFSEQCRPRLRPRSYHYKLLDRGVKVMPL